MISLKSTKVYLIGTKKRHLIRTYEKKKVLIIIIWVLPYQFPPILFWVWTFGTLELHRFRVKWCTHFTLIVGTVSRLFFIGKNISKKQSTFDLGPNCRTNGNPIVGLELTTSWIKRALLQRVRVWGRSHVLYDCSCQTQVKETKTASKEPS